MIGTPSASDYELLAEQVPFDRKLFNEFPVIPRDIHTMARLYAMFDGVADKESLVNLLLRCFSYVPEHRITASQALQHPYFDDIKAEYAKLPLRS